MQCPASCTPPPPPPPPIPPHEAHAMLVVLEVVVSCYNKGEVQFVSSHMFFHVQTSGKVRQGGTLPRGTWQ